ncbi:hypothetical protein METUNv1_03083 [Methyloversatilis universalis FAM5]|uniref:Uncharacterized protein n=1 Tax=Methyloversatilis universalis (strain ATCC BAA-1314 / DSM 25237 / JCM 13912 / CCUG 52030 / FAM5) TaxID=1000565 RepID=F5RFK2_METUF|nr:hypothetical protein METUNv1_03083 [Methyloversatilis universalis FAM5]
MRGVTGCGRDSQNQGHNFEQSVSAVDRLARSRRGSSSRLLARGGALFLQLLHFGVRHIAYVSLRVGQLLACLRHGFLIVVMRTCLGHHKR